MHLKRHLFLCLAILCGNADAAPSVAPTAPTAPPPPPRHILFAIADDWGAFAGAYGTKWVSTPAFDRVAKEGLLFQRAYTPNAKCAPSRSCILTGRNSWQLKEAANHLCFFPTEFKSWMEALKELGWSTGHTTKGWGPGEAKDAQGKPRQLTGAAFNKKTAPSPASGIGRSDYAGNFKDFLDASPADQPWCFWYGCVEPHREYEEGSGVAKGHKKVQDIDHVPAYWPDNDLVRSDMLDYAFEIEHFDRHLGRMLAELEQRKLLESTLVIVTSDHGPPFPRLKGNVYEAANRVPLAIRWPEAIRNPGRVVNDFVSFIDIAPTIFDYVKPTSFPPTTGRSWRPLFEDQKTPDWRSFVLLGKERTDIGRPNDGGYPTRGIRQDQWLYVRNYEPKRWPAGNPETGYLDCDGGATKSHILERHRKDESDPFWQLCFGIRPPEELYDLSTDPDAVKNLATSAEHQAARARLTSTMDEALKKEGDPRQFGEGAVFDAYPHAAVKNQHFYEKFMAGERLPTGWINPTDVDPVKP